MCCGELEGDEDDRDRDGQTQQSNRAQGKEREEHDAGVDGRWTATKKTMMEQRRG